MIRSTKLWAGVPVLFALGCALPGYDERLGERPDGPASGGPGGTDSGVLDAADGRAFDGSGAPDAADSSIFARDGAAEGSDREAPPVDGVAPGRTDAADASDDRSTEPHDSTVADGDGAITDRDGTMADRDGAITDRDGTMADRDDAVADRDGAMADGDFDATDAPECQPASAECRNRDLWTCVNGHWTFERTCSYVCDVDRCAGECVPDKTRCVSSAAVQTCSSHGTWSSLPETCIHQTCYQDRCVGECAPTEKQCAPGGIPQSCGTDGQWVKGTACTPMSQRCSAGVCEVNPEYLFGNGQRFAGDSTVTASSYEGVLYMMRLGAPSARTQVQSIGVWSASNGGVYAYLSVYEADFGALPSKLILRTSSSVLLDASGQHEEVPYVVGSATNELLPSKDYWIAVEFTNGTGGSNELITATYARTANTNIKRVNHTYGTTLPQPPVFGSDVVGVEWNLFLRVRDVTP